MDTKTFHVKDLMLHKVLEHYNKDFDLSNVKEAIFDFDNMHTVEPLAMLLLSNRLRIAKEEYNNTIFRAINFKKGYASHMGFFQSFGLNHGNSPGEASGSNSYIPITTINVKKLREESYYKENGIVQEVIKDKSKQMARVLCGNNNEVLNSIYQCIREILRNTVEHSESENIWIAAQRWEYEGRIEIAILDEGVGINQA